MKNKPRALLLTFLLLIINTTQSSASTISTLDDVNITFSNGYQLSGQIGFYFDAVGFPSWGFPVVGPAGLSLNGVPFFRGSGGAPNGSTLDAIFFTPSIPDITYFADFGFNFNNLPNNLTYADLILSLTGTNGPNLNPPIFTGVSGTISCVEGCDALATPLPASWLLFGTGLLLFAGCARMKKATLGKRF